MRVIFSFETEVKDELFGTKNDLRRLAIAQMQHDVAEADSVDDLINVFTDWIETRTK